MIKLIAADMDGTLLDSQQRLSVRLFPVIRELKTKGIRFAIASGRQYYNLLERFSDLKDDLFYISENGAMVFDGTQPLFVAALSPNDLQEPIALARSLPNTCIVLCGQNSAYIEHNDPVFLEHAGYYYTRLTRVQNILEAAHHDTIFKIAFFCSAQAEIKIYPILQKFHERFHVLLSGDSWVDFMPLGVHKGSALQQIQRKMGITSANTMAFGDYLNDCTMMQAADHSYAMANAHPDLRAICHYQAPSNDNDGVVQVLVRQFALDC